MKSWGTPTKYFYFSLFLIGLGVLFIPIPYFVMQPGSAQDVSSFVKVGDYEDNAPGDFYLTTISLKEGMVFDYLLALLSDEMELVPEEEILVEDESEEDYHKRQELNMAMSQNQALVAAFQFAKRPVFVHSEGIEVFGLMNKENRLQKGDLIKKVDGTKVQSVNRLTQYLSQKKEGEEVRVEIIRDEQTLELNIPLVSLPTQPGEDKRVGLGIYPVPRLKVVTNPPAQIRTEEIGGPSAGLMFSLEVLDHLFEGSLSKGYKVAGTGTISEAGEVGQIGGIEFKVIAADRKGADIFFCPKDQTPQDQNEKKAKEAASRIKTKMKIVPVSSLEEAVNYLQQLPVKR